MKLKPILIFLLLLFYPQLRVFTQSAGTPAAVLGSQALRPRLGNPASWRIDIFEAKMPDANQGSSGIKSPEVGKTAEPETISTDRANNILRCTLKEPLNDQDTFWFFENMIVVNSTAYTKSVSERRKKKIAKNLIFKKSEGSPSYFVITPETEDRPPVDFSKSDFPELEWIRNLTSSGTTKVDGIQCYIFREPEMPADRMTTTNSNLQSTSGNSSSRVAYVDIANARPVLIWEGGKVHEYSYPTPPQSIELPGGAKEAGENYTEWYKKTFPPMSTP